MGYIFKGLNMTKIKEIFRGPLKLIKDRVSSVHYDEKLLERLRNGNFENVEFNLLDWFNNQYYEYLKVAADGCAINGNSELLYQIFTLLDGKMNNPNAEDLYTNRSSVIRAIKRNNFDCDVLEYSTVEQLYNILNGQIRDSAVDVMLRYVISSALALEGVKGRSREILLQLSYSTDPHIRERMNKIALRRQEFTDRWLNHPEDAKLFLFSALESNHIDSYVYSDIVYNASEAKHFYVTFVSPLIKRGQSETIELDESTLNAYRSNDLEQLAEFLYLQIKNENVFLANEAHFLCYVERKSKSI